MSEDVAAALWSLVQAHLPYRIERAEELGVQWSEEDEAMVQLLDQKWIADIEARGALRANRAWLKEDIAKRFGALPAEVATRIDSIENEDHLDAVKSRLDTATSLDQLFR